MYDKKAEKDRTMINHETQSNVTKPNWDLKKNKVKESGCQKVQKRESVICQF